MMQVAGLRTRHCCAAGKEEEEVVLPSARTHGTDL